MSEVRAIGTRHNNAQLMADCAQLGYLDGRVLDLTYGTGRFWRDFRPDDLTTNDLYSEEAHLDLDFRGTDLPAVSFDTVVFDPPYKLNGTGGSHVSDEGYGVAGPYRSVEDKMMLITRGVREGVRLSRRFLLVKCQDQVVSGRVVWQTITITDYARSLNIGGRYGRLIDMLHVQGYRQQPPGRRQVHARRDYSTLLVFEIAK